MMRRATFVIVFLVLGFLAPLKGRTQSCVTTDLNGQWYGVGWDAADEFSTTTIDIFFTESGGTGTAVAYVPEFGLFDTSFPLTVVGDEITIGDPGVLGFTGTIVGEMIEGECWEASSLVATWYIAKQTGETTLPGPAPGPVCDDLPPMMCIDGGVDDCTELIPFEPAEGPGYINYPVFGETWDDQVYSYLRRDYVYLIKYATAKVECKTADWDYGNFAPLGLGDMSEEDGSIPGTSIGQPRHPPGTHEDGKDIDTAYYQLFSPDNLLRAVGDHYIGTTDQLHLVAEPYALDRWRTALYIAYLSEHPNLRVIGVDGQVGLVLEATLDELVTLGWIDEELRASIPLVYELVDEGLGWYYYHHNHMHISMLPDLTDVLEQSQTPPVTQLMDCYPNPFNPSTTIAFSLAQLQPVKLSIHDVAGRLVSRLIDGEILPAGLHEVNWRGRDRLGRLVSSGVYFYRLEAGDYVESKQMVLVR